MESREVQLKPGKYTTIVRDHDKPIILIAERAQYCLHASDYAHKDFATSAEALYACKHDPIFSTRLVCVYNLVKQEYVQHDKLPTQNQIPAINTIIAMYLNK